MIKFMMQDSLTYTMKGSTVLIFAWLAVVVIAAQDQKSQVNEDGVDESGWDPMYREYRDKHKYNNVTDTRDKSEFSFESVLK